MFSSFTLVLWLCCVVRWSTEVEGGDDGRVRSARVAVQHVHHVLERFRLQTKHNSQHVCWNICVRWSPNSVADVLKRCVRNRIFSSDCGVEGM